MEITLTLEQISYIKSLYSKKKQRKFLLESLVENITSLGESVKISDLPSKTHPTEMDWTTTTAPRTFEGILNRQEYGTEDFNFGKAYVEAMDRIIPKDESDNSNHEKNYEILLYNHLSAILNTDPNVKYEDKVTVKDVKRLSDGEIFKVGDLTNKGVITKFEENNNHLSVIVGDQKTLLRTLYKIEKPLEKYELLKFDAMDEPKRNLTVFEIIKSSDYFKELLEKCFNESRLTHSMIGFKHETFEDYFKTID